MTKLFISLQTRLVTLRDREDGAAAAEYGLLVALIAAVIIATVQILGNDINKAFKAITDVLPS